MTPKQAALLKKAKRSLHTARRNLAEDDADFAASRTYYAMFYAAEALLLSKGLTYKSHAAVIASIGEHFASKGEMESIHHQNIMAAQYARNAGDYLTEFNMSNAEVEEHMGNAEQFINMVEKKLS